MLKTCLIVAWKKIIISGDSTCIIVNAENDSIYIKYLAQKGEKWEIYKYRNGKYIVGEITRIELRKVLNEFDSVKSIELHLLDSNGISEDSLFDDVEIHLSRKYGNVSIINLGLFPDLYKYNNPLIKFKIYEINTSDQSKKYELTKEEVYDFSVGDEFHYIIDYEDEFHVRPKQIIKKIIDKQFSVNHDSVTYITDRLTWEEIFKSLPEPHLELVISHDTITETYSDLNKSVIENNLSPFENIYCYDSTFINNYIIPIDSSKYNNRITIFYPAKEYTIDDLMKDCFVNTFSISSHSIYRNIYIQGCGSLEYNYSYDGILRIKDERLVYLKKRDESWGVRLYVPTFIERDKLDNFILYPNPNHGIFTISLPNLYTVFYDIIIYDSYGTKIYQKKVKCSTTNMMVDISQYPAGIYLLQVKSKEQIFNTSIIFY